MGIIRRRPVFLLLSASLSVSAQAGIARLLCWWDRSRADALWQLTITYLFVAAGLLIAAVLIAVPRIRRVWAARGPTRWLIEPYTDEDALGCASVLAGAILGGLSGYTVAGIGSAALCAFGGAILGVVASLIPFGVVIAVEEVTAALGSAEFWNGVGEAVGSLLAFLIGLGLLILFGWFVYRYWGSSLS